MQCRNSIRTYIITVTQPSPNVFGIVFLIEKGMTNHDCLLTNRGWSSLCNRKRDDQPRLVNRQSLFYCNYNSVVPLFCILEVPITFAYV